MQNSCYNLCPGIVRSCKKGLRPALSLRKESTAARATDSPRESVGASLRMWEEGFLSAHAVQQICHMAHMDGLKHDAVGHLASMGSWGWKCHSGFEGFHLPRSSVSWQAWNPRMSQNEASKLAYFDPKDVFDSLLRGRTISTGS